MSNNERHSPDSHDTHTPLTPFQIFLLGSLPFTIAAVAWAIFGGG